MGDFTGLGVGVREDFLEKMKAELRSELTRKGMGGRTRAESLGREGVR